MMKDIDHVSVRSDDVNEVSLNFVRHPNSRPRCKTILTGLRTRTDNAHKDLTDINNIVNRFQRTGSMPTGKGPGVYEDVTLLQGDLTDVINRSKDIVEKAEKVKVALEKAKAEEEEKVAAADFEKRVAEAAENRIKGVTQEAKKD